MKTDANDSTKADAQEVKVDDAEDLKTPKYGPLRKASQKLQQLFLNYPSSYALAMMTIAVLKLFIQIFDIWTDVAIGKITTGKCLFFSGFLSQYILGSQSMEVCGFDRFYNGSLGSQVDELRQLYQREVHPK